VLAAGVMGLTPYWLFLTPVDLDGILAVSRMLAVEAGVTVLPLRRVATDLDGGQLLAAVRQRCFPHSTCAKDAEQPCLRPLPVVEPAALRCLAVVRYGVW
jgi:hypothetical protein